WQPIDQLRAPMQAEQSSPDSFRAARPASSDPLRVVTYNTEYGQDAAGLAAAILGDAELARAGVFLFQEEESHPSEGRSRAALLAGDFNTNWLSWAGSVPVLADDRDQAPIVDSYMTSLGFDLPSARSGPTERAYGLEFRLDSIYTRGLDVAFGGVVHTGPSD